MLQSMSLQSNFKITTYCFTKTNIANIKQDLPSTLITITCISEGSKNDF